MSDAPPAMKPPAPPRVRNIEDYWTAPPPERSSRCDYWVRRINFENWYPSGRLMSEGYYGSADYYGVYLWEYLNVISPLLNEKSVLRHTEEKP